MLSPFLSIVIPTRNHADLLFKALHSLLYQTVPSEQFEVLVMDNGSKDHTREIVAQIQDELKNLHYFFTSIPGLHVARHLGMEKAHGEILAYIDDDVEVAPTWLEAIAEGFSRPEVSMVGGKCLPKFESTPPHWLMKRWTSPMEYGKFFGSLSILDFGEAIKKIPPTFVIGCNFAIRRQALLAAGGFHPDSMPSDLLFYRGDGETWVAKAVAALGGKALYHPRAAVCHCVPAARMTFDYIYRRAFAEGITRSFVSIRRSHGMDIASVSGSPPKPPWRQRMRGSLLRLACVLPFHHRLQRVERKGLRDGFHAHRTLFARDQELRTWVLKKDWLHDPVAGRNA